MARLPFEANGLAHINAGLTRLREAPNSFAVLRSAPKTLAELVALAKVSATKQINLRTRATGLSKILADAESKAKTESRDIVAEKRDNFIRDRIAAARAEWLAKTDKGDSARMRREVADNHARGQAIAGRYASEIGYLMLRTAHGSDATSRREELQLLGTAGTVELASAIADAVLYGSAPKLAACVQRCNALAKDDRDQIMPLLKSAADELVGHDCRVANAAILSMHCDHLDSEIHAATIENVELPHNAKIEVGMLRKFELEPMTALLDPAPGQLPTDPDELHRIAKIAGIRGISMEEAAVIAAQT